LTHIEFLSTLIESIKFQEEFMLESLFGSQSKEQVLLYIVGRGNGYASQIAEYFNTAVTPIKRQLENLEYNSVLVSETVGRTKLFSMNPRYVFQDEVKALIEKEINYLNAEERERLLNVRTRPRRTGKPL
jgi:predicted ArsR family transcriptional regulator